MAHYNAGEADDVAVLGGTAEENPVDINGGRAFLLKVRVVRHMPARLRHEQTPTTNVLSKYVTHNAQVRSAVAGPSC